MRTALNYKWMRTGRPDQNGIWDALLYDASANIFRSNKLISVGSRNVLDNSRRF